MRFALSFLVALVSLVASAQATLRDSLLADKGPRLVVLIVIDQFRGDYLTRFRDLYLPARKGGTLGGFRFLMEEGAFFTNGRFDHIPLETGVGHSVIGTGAPPFFTGIAGNEWFDRATRKAVYCTQDPLAAGEMSPRNLLCTTFGDELEVATGGKAKVVSISIKDRAAILQSGHLPDAVVWYDSRTGQARTGKYYHGGRVPAWAQQANEQKLADKYKDRVWEALVPQAHDRCIPVPAGNVGAPASFGARFPHKLDGKDSGYYSNLRLTPWGTEWTLELARRAAVAEQMGKDDVADALLVSISSNDYLGHAFGPDSPEVLELCVATDRMLSEFFNWLNSHVPGGIDRCLIALTADHGVAPIPEQAIRSGIGAGRLDMGPVYKKIVAALDERFPGDGDWRLGEVAQWVHYDPDTAKARKADPEAVEKVIANVLQQEPGVFAAYTRTQYMEGRLPVTELAKTLYRSFRPDRCGDVHIVLQPWWMLGAYPSGTTHGQPFVYDTHVPILFRGPGIQPGMYIERVSPEDIAPTIATVLGTTFPSACVGRPIGLNTVRK